MAKTEETAGTDPVAAPVVTPAPSKLNQFKFK